MNKRVSAVIPVYKVENYLQRCINSFLRIESNGVEIILTDDGTPDGSAAICDEQAFKNPNIMVIHKYNEGVSVARNIGIEVCSGDYLFFCDSDDEIMAESLTKAMLDSEPDFDMVVCGFETYTNDYHRNEIRTVKQLSRESILIFKDNFQRSLGIFWKNNNMLSSCAKLYKREIIMVGNVRFNPSMVILEDYDFVLSILSHCKKIASSKETVYRYYQEKSGLPYYAKRSRLNYTDDVISAYQKHCAFFCDNDILEGESHWYIWKDLFGNFGTALSALWAIPTGDLQGKCRKCHQIRDVLKTPAFQSYIEFCKYDFTKREYFLMKHPTSIGIFALRKVRALLGK